jgi:hypothetical protein
VASVVGGKRRGPQTQDGDGGGLSDIKDVPSMDVHIPSMSIECKLLGAPGYMQMLAATRQAESAASDGEMPIAFIKKKYVPNSDALVVIRLEVFEEFFKPT